MADILLKDLDGTPTPKEGVDKGINVLLTDGTEKIYVDSDEVPAPVGRTVELDFSGGDMTITPEEGQVFSTILIPKPPNLIPGNIPKDLDIAGIIGTMAAGGKDNVRVASGTFTSPYVGTITHGLGVVPDFALVACISSSISRGNAVVAFGFSEAFITQNPAVPARWMTYHRSDNVVSAYAATTPITGSTQGTFSAPVAIGNATETTFDYGGKDHAGNTIRFSSDEKIWIAIGGLT